MVPVVRPSNVLVIVKSTLSLGFSIPNKKGKKKTPVKTGIASFCMAWASFQDEVSV